MMRSSDSLCNSIDALRSINPINDRLVSQYRIGSVSSSRLCSAKQGDAKSGNRQPGPAKLWVAGGVAKLREALRTSCFH